MKIANLGVESSQSDIYYESLLSCNKLQIAWEFLRRNVRYQEAYKWSAEHGDGGGLSPVDFAIVEFVDPDVSPLPHKSFSALFRPVSFSTVASLSRKIVVHNGKRVSISKTIFRLKERSIVPISFDLRYDIESQLHSARAVLSKLQRASRLRESRGSARLPAKHDDHAIAKYIHLLRVFDSAEGRGRVALANQLQESYKNSYPQGGRGRPSGANYLANTLTKHILEANRLVVSEYRKLIHVYVSEKSSGLSAEI